MVDFLESFFVLGVVEFEGVELVVIWNMYYYWDYMDGNKGLLEVYLDLVVYGYELDKGWILG